MEFEKNKDNLLDLRPRYGNKTTTSYSHSYKPLCCLMSTSYVQPKERVKRDLIPVKFDEKKSSPINTPEVFHSQTRFAQTGIVDGGREVTNVQIPTKDIHALHVRTKATRHGADHVISKGSDFIHPDSPREGLSQPHGEEKLEKSLNDRKETQSELDHMLNHPEGVFS